MNKSKKFVSALLALSFAFAAGGAVAVIGARENAISAYAEETGAYNEVAISGEMLSITVPGTDDIASRINLAISGSDWENAAANTGLQENTYAEGLNTFQGMVYNTGEKNTYKSLDVYFNLWEYGANSITIDTSNATEITFKKGTKFPSYAYTQSGTGDVYVLSEDVKFVRESNTVTVWERELETVDINGAFSVRPTQVSAGDSKIYTIDSNVKFFGGDATWLMDHYSTLQDYILINGKTVTEINTETDDSAYEYTNFPGSIGGVYAVPVRVNVGFENEATRLNVYIHNDYLAANEIVSIGIKSGFEMKDTENAYKATEDRVFYAYDGTFAEKCKVYFDGEEATGYIGHGIPAASVPTNPSKESTATTDYTFSGWYDEEGNAWDWTTKLTGDVKLVSHYAENARKYTITYFNADGSVYDTQEVANGESISLIATPEKTGYTAEWSAAHEYATMPTEDISYTVKYEIITYTIVFEVDGETVATKTYTIENENFEEPAVPDKEGYTGEWDSYTKFSAKEIVVRATYTLIEDDTSSSDDTSDVSSSDDTSDSTPDESSSDDTSDSTPDESSSDDASDSTPDVSSSDETSDGTPDESSSDETSDSTPDVSSSDEVGSSTATESNKKNGCSGSIACLPVVAMFGLAAALLKKKRK